MECNLKIGKNIDVMLLGLNETIDQLAMASSVYGMIMCSILRLELK